MVAAAEFSFYSTQGLDSDSMMDPIVVFDSRGAIFGTLCGGDNGRNHMRTATDPICSNLAILLVCDLRHNCQGGACSPDWT